MPCFLRRKDKNYICLLRNNITKRIEENIHSSERKKPTYGSVSCDIIVQM
jgi:hypothetical protein